MAITFSQNMATMPKDGSTCAVLFCTYSTQTGAITGRFIRMVKWSAAANDFVEDTPSPLDVAGRYLAFATTGALPF